MNDLVAATVFVLGLSLLLIAGMSVLRPLLPSVEVHAPVGPSEQMPHRLVYVYLVDGRWVAVAAPPDFDVGVLFGGDPVAVFEVYPGGYRCASPLRVEVGDDPYRGFWCPPPTADRPPACVPVGLSSRGRWLTVDYAC